MRAGIGCLPFLFLFPLVFFVIWVVSIFDVLRRPEESFKDSTERIMWILIVFFGNFLGALIYQIFGKRN